VFTRAQLLQEVWGYDFFGGTRTVDVHVRRLRAKLGTEYESLIGTVRNVGYKAVRPARGRPSPDTEFDTDLEARDEAGDEAEFEPASELPQTVEDALRPSGSSSPDPLRTP
jgi:DNA-binding winged helix-turn-helix (wHTH) protein